MDWLRLFVLLTAVTSIQVTAEGSKKKIRIHLPQKVKHIHHHKKIYITNHHASSQYAPAYLPSAEGAVAVPTNIALPAVTNVLPLNSVELYDDSKSRLPRPAASKLLPLYRARGYYGPTPAEWDEPEYDIASTNEPSDNNYSPPASVPAPAPNHPPKRVKIIKVNEQPPKKGARKPNKPKRVPVRGRPPTEDEHPVSKFHEQFYSDLEGSGTIRKIKKPQRVEKIIDGDTEHIHTYSEEHIHKLVFDDGSTKLTNVVGVDPVGSMSAISPVHPLIPIKNSPGLLAIPSETFAGFAAVGSLGTPSHLEYASYNPREVTHDHIFHDHGEIPSDVDLSREPIGYPPKVSYNSQGLRISDGNSHKIYKNKYPHKYLKATKPAPLNDLSYYESLYTPSNRLKKQPNPTAISHFESSLQPSLEDYRPIPAFNVVGRNSNKIRSTYNNVQQTHDHRQHTNSLPPFSVSSTVIHDYQPKPSYPGALPPTGFSKYKDPLVNFKDSYSNNYEYDTYASSSNIYTSEDKNDNTGIPLKNVKGKKKSISTQNISFGGQDHQTMVDHFDDSNIPSESINHETSLTAFEDVNSYDKDKVSDSVTPTPYTIKETSPAHLYYTAMAIKALYNEPASMPEASNDNLQYVEAPTQSTTPYTPTAATTTSSPNAYFEIQNSNVDNSEQSNYVSESEQRQKKKHRSNAPNREPNQRYSVIQDLRPRKQFGGEERQPLSRKLLHHSHQLLQESTIDSSARGKLKYGDKI